MYRHFFKRLIDILFSLLLLVVLFPVMAITAVLIFLATKRSPFFTQVRPGKNAKLFRLVKFKSMTDARDTSGELLPDHERMTGTGRFIRKTSLDELPQLINVLKGEMSLVGPRPLLVEYLSLYDSVQSRRHEVLPGITGWAQVNGRNAISWEEKFALDVWYVDHVSLAVDVKIVARTLLKVFNSNGVDAAANISMEKFTGTKHNL